ncbi:hypothetical protein Plhal703r1_c42g0141641 [Plasmopara halstedii]
MGNLILDGNYLERCEEIAEAENLVLDQQQIDVLQKFVEAATKQNAKGKDIESTLKRDSMAIDQFERKMKQLKVKTSVKLKATTKTKEITGSYSPVQQG